MDKEKQIDEVVEKEKTQEEGVNEEKEETVKNPEEDKKEFIEDIEKLFSYLGNVKGTVVNCVVANEINDSSFFQKQEKESLKEGQKIYCLTEENGFWEFMQKYRNTRIQLYMLVTVGLGTVEKSQLDHLAISLNHLLGMETEDIAPDYGCSFTELRLQLNLTECVIKKETFAGTTDLDAIGYNKEQLDILRKLLWKEYIQLREPLLEWLLRLNETCDYPISICAGEALSEFSVIDFGYVYEHIIKQMLRRDTISNTGCLSRILLKTGGIKKYEANVAELVNNILDRRRSNFCISAMTYYLNFPEMIPQEKIDNMLKVVIKSEREGRKLFQNIIVLLRKYPIFASIFYRNVMEIYDEQGRYSDRKRVCEKVLSGLRLETYVLWTGSPKLMLIEELNDKRTREETTRLWRDIWQRKEMRMKLCDILDNYFGIGKNYVNFCTKYMYLFFRTLSFSGQKTDFDNMMLYLERSIYGEKSRIKEELKKYLIELRDSR